MEYGFVFCLSGVSDRGWMGGGLQLVLRGRFGFVENGVDGRCSAGC